MRKISIVMRSDAEVKLRNSLDEVGLCIERMQPSRSVDLTYDDRKISVKFLS